MSSERKTLKIICFIYAVVAVISVVLGVMALTSASAHPQPWGIVCGILQIVAGIVYFAFCAAGIQGANTPHKAGKAKTLAIVSLVAAILVGMASVPFNEGAIVSVQSIVGLVALVLAACGIVYAGKVTEQAER